MAKEKKIRTINIGKYGLSDGVIKEITNYLKEHEEVKLKFLSSIVQDQKSFQTFIDELLEKIPKVKIAKKIGHTVILKKKRD